MAREEQEPETANRQRPRQRQEEFRHSMSSMNAPSAGLREQFGEIDIYLFDQLLKGRISPGMRILDAGCGGGRNLVYLLRQGHEVFAADADPQAVDSVRSIARKLAPAANIRP